MSIFVILGLQLVCTQVQESSAVTSVFVQKGKDVQLNVTETDVPKDFFVIHWTINKDAVATFFPDKKPTVGDFYTGRIDFPVKKYCMKLKNLQETDSGLYIAQVIRNAGNQDLARYNVAVQEPVSPVKLSVDSVSTSSDSCNVTVSCSTQDSHISSTFTCDTNTCSQEGGERSEATTSGASLSVYLLNDSITCNHSNQVSWTEDVTKIQDFCPCHVGSQCVSAGVSVCLVKTVVFSVGLIVMVSAVITVHIVERLKKQK